MLTWMLYLLSSCTSHCAGAIYWSEEGLHWPQTLGSPEHIAPALSFMGAATSTLGPFHTWSILNGYNPHPLSEGKQYAL